MMKVAVPVIPALMTLLISVASTTNSTLFDVVLANPDSQFIGNFERSVLNITYNFSTSTNLSNALEQCADVKLSLLFTINGSALGCGTTNPNLSSFSSNRTKSATNTTNNCNATSCQVNTTTEQNLTQWIGTYKTEFYSVVYMPIFVGANYIVHFPNNESMWINMSFNPGDGNPDLTSLANGKSLSFSHRYLTYGTFRAHVQSIGNSTALVDISRRVVVTIPSVIQNFSCPDLFVTNKTSSCLFNVIQAMQMEAGVQTGDSVKVNHIFSGSPVEIISKKNQTLQRLNCSASSVVFERQLRVQAFELVSAVSGPLVLQVFRSTDQATGNLHELPTAYSCPDTSSLNQTTNVTICFQTVFLGDQNASRMSSSAVQVIAVHSLTLTVDAGYNFIILKQEDTFTANPGDVIRLTVSHPAEVGSSSLTHITNSTCVFQDLALYGFSPYQVRIRLRFMDPGVFPVGIKVRDATQDLTDVKEMASVQRPVGDLKLSYKSIVRYNSTHTLGFRLASGTNASCAWSLTGQGLDVRGMVNSSATEGNGNQSARTSWHDLGTSLNFTFDVPGTLTYLVLCTNKVSNTSEDVSISVRRNISDFNASLCFASLVYQYAKTCWKAVAFGDVVEYQWIVRDHVFKDRQFETKFPYSSLPPRNQELFNVTANNVVSKESLVVWFKILDNPLSIKTVPSLIVPSLSPLSIIPMLHWQGYASGTEFYEKYAVNVSENLRQFITSPTFHIKVDGAPLANNISNATLLNYTFPLAGRETEKHEIQIEATGHPEMNRQKEITIVDRIQGLKITSSCQSEVVVNETCALTASYDQGSNVTCKWMIASQILSSTCQVSYKFDQLGNVIIQVNSSNAVSFEQFSLDVTVVRFRVTYTKSTIVSIADELFSTLGMTPSISPHTGVSLVESTKGMHLSIGEAVSVKTVSTRSNFGNPSLSPSRVAPLSISSSIANTFQKLVIIGPQFGEIGKTIVFSASIFGAYSVLTWSINGTSQPGRNSSISVSFNQSGLFNISLSVSHLNQRWSTSVPITIQSRISDLQVQVHQNSFSKSVVVLLSIRIGTDVSYSVDFADGSTPTTGIVRELMKNVSVLHRYEKPAVYNVSVFVFNMVGPNLTDTVPVTVKERCVFNSVVLYGASGDVRYSREFTETDKIVVSVRTNLECSLQTQIRYDWMILGLDSGISDAVPMTLKDTTTNRSTLQFPASRITIGSYKVLVTVIASLDGSSVTRSGYLRKVARNLIVACSCGSARTIAVDEPLTLKSTVIDGVSDSNALMYEWFCDSRLSISCFKDVVARNMSVLSFPGNFLDLRETYNFLVRVSDGKGQGSTSQTVTVGSPNSNLPLCLRCPQDQRKAVLHTQETDLIATCTKCPASLNVTWTWCLIKKPQLTSQLTCSFAHLTVDSDKLIIPRNTLNPNTSYVVEVNATSSAHSGYASYELVTNDLPSGGYCDITPSEGFVLTTTFRTACYAWHDRHQPLSYKYTYSIDGTNYNVFYHGHDSESAGTYFETGLSSRNYIVNIRVNIEDSLGAFVVNHLTVQNFPLSESKLDEVLNSFGNINQRVDEMLDSNNTQGAIQFMKTVSSLLNGRSGDIRQQEERVKIRQTFLHHLAALCCSDISPVKQTITAMLAVSQVPSELNLDAQSYASGIYLNMSTGLSATLLDAKIKNISRDLVQGLSFVLTASSLASDNIAESDSQKLREINDACLLALDKLGDALLGRMNPEDPPVMLTTSWVNIALQKHLATNLSGRVIGVSRHQTKFTLPKTIGNITGSVVSTKLTSTLNNAFSWIPASAAAPTTSVASFVLKDSQEREIVMSNLPEPFSMFLYRPDSEPVLLNYSAELDEYSDPAVYEINTTKASPSLLVTLHQVSSDTKGQLLLRIKKENQSTPLRSDVILTTASFPVSLTYNGLMGEGKYYVTVEFESFSFRVAGAPNKIQYTISFQEVGCVYLNESSNGWESNGCQVGPLSTHQRTHCLCDHLTWFGGQLVVPPNTISLSTIAERIQDPGNYATILAVLCSIFILYLVTVVWARRRDKQDADKNRITWCPTNHVTDSHQYHVIVYTGIRRNAGTSANVGLMLLGDFEKSRKCLLKDSRKAVLQRGSVDRFLVTTTGSLGQLEYLHIWHDNTGSDPGWFVNRVVVVDCRSERVWNFLCYRWLAVDEGDGQIQRLLPIADSEDLVRFRHLFVSRATSELTDAHLWFSVAFRPAFSPFTRVQRVSCCLSLLLTSMMTNAMWYETGGSGGAQVDLGLVSFSWDTIFIGLCSSVIVFPVNLLLVQIFRHRRVKKSPKSTSLLKKESFKMSPLFPVQSPAKLWPLPSDVVTSCGVTPPSTSERKTSQSYVMAPQAASQESGSRKMTSAQSMTSSYDMTSLQKTTSSFDMTSFTQVKEDSRDHDAFLLPYWFTYIGWLTILVTCLTSASVTFMYGIQFGENKTRKWLLSLTISIVNDVFVAQPLKVLAVAVVLAYIIKKPLREHYSIDAISRLEVVETIPSEGPELEAPDPNACMAEDFLKTAREKREKDKFMYGLLKTVSSYLVFMFLVLVIAYGQRDPRAFYQTRAQEYTFTEPDFVEKVEKGPGRGFHQVNNVRDFWRWNRVVFLPGLSNLQWFNYSKQWSSFTANFGGFLFGAARWRQKRLKKGLCQVLPTFEEIIPDCTGNYGWSREDVTNYLNSWKSPLVNRSCHEANDPRCYWCFGSTEAFQSYPYVGRLETYSKGGYDAEILQDYNRGLNLTEDFKRRRWIDRYTRAIFVEFTLYNPNVNLFSVVTLLFEVSSSGNFNPTAEILSFRLYHYVGNFQIFVLVCQLVFLGFLCSFTYRSVKLLYMKRWNYFTEPWNVYEFMVVGLSWVAVIFYFISMALREWILGKFREDPTRFISFWHSSTWQVTEEYVIAWLVFLISLKPLRFFQFNRRMFLLPLTLSSTALELLNYSLVFFIVLTSFTLLYHLMLHAYSLDFVSIIATVETLIRVLLGKSDAVARYHQFPVLERVILFCYMCLMKFILLNVFVVILNDGFRLARAQNDRQRNDFEFIEFVKHTVYDFLGIRRLYNKKSGGKFSKSRKNSSKRRRIRFAKPHMTGVELALEKLENRVETVCQLINSVSFEEDLYDD